MPHYDISWGDPHERILDVTITFTAPTDRPRLILPSWRPGRYLIQNFAMNVREWSSNLTKESKAVWRADARAGEEVRVGYRYYAGVLDAGSSLLDPAEVYVNPSNLLMMVEGLREERCTLKLHVPDDWTVETQLPPDGARDYDYLIDSPIIAAPRMTRHGFDEAGATFHLVCIGDEGIDTAALVAPLRAIVRAQAELWGGLPFSEYRFLVHVADRWHGVEHEDSCSMIVKRGGDDFFNHFLTLASHELIHAWLVKRIIPAAFLPYDYTTETTTRLLWVMEGITSYYGELSLVRAGVWDEKRYLKHLQEEIEILENAPARRHLSLSQVSFDAWLHDPAKMHDKANSSYSFYTKGELVAMLLDLELRQRGRSLDELMRALWREYGSQWGAGALAGESAAATPRPRGLEEDAIERAAGPEFADFFERYVHGVDPLPYAEALDAAGIDYLAEPRGPSLGAKLRGAEADSVIHGGTAMAAGVLAGDEIIAVHGNRTRSDAEVRKVFARLEEGDEVEITISRAGVVRRLHGNVRRDPGVDVKLHLRGGDNALRREWLRRIE